MLPKRLELRFGVKRPDGYRSLTRKVSSRKNDVYLAQREDLGAQKFSFHGAGVRSQYGLTEQHVAKHGMPPGLSDRLPTKWRRDPIPPAPLAGSVVAELVVPTDFLSRLPEMPGGLGKRVRWVPAAPAGEATVVDVFFTHDPPERICGATFEGRLLGLLGHASLANGENVAIVYRYAEYDNQEPQSPITIAGMRLLFSADDPIGTGRPVRFTYHPLVVPRGATTIFELGGYAVD